ncbi:hypothetical protein BSNK01_15850 [Bacillaceae bacterium]
MARHFVEKLNRRLQKPIESISPELLDILQRYDWPGNVLSPDDLPEELAATTMTAEADDSLPVKDEIKKQALIRSLRACNGNYKQAARLLGISRSTLYRQLKKYNLR